MRKKKLMLDFTNAQASLNFRCLLAKRKILHKITLCRQSCALSFLLIQFVILQQVLQDIVYSRNCDNMRQDILSLGELIKMFSRQNVLYGELIILLSVGSVLLNFIW